MRLLLLSPILQSGGHQIGVRCNASQEFVVRPGTWNTRVNGATDIALSIRTTRQ